MGSSQSKPKPNPPSRRELIQEKGVLIPPLFAIAGNHANSSNNHDGLTNRLSPSSSSCALSVLDRLPLTPSLVDYLTATHLGQGILLDSMTPGIWVSAGGTDITTTTIRASLPQSNAGGRISFASAHPDGGARVELQAGTRGPMHLMASYPLIPNHGLLYAHVTTGGTGHVGGQVGITVNRTTTASSGSDDDDSDDDPIIAWDKEDEEDYNKIRFQVGSWVPLQANLKRKKKNAIDNNSNNVTNFFKPPEHVHGFVSVDMLGSTTVVETKCNLDTLENQVSKYFSMRLYGGEQRQQTDDNNATMPSPKSPPLWLTMTSTPQTSTINVSQLLTFDRINLNIADTRAPYVRNTFGWSVQLERPNNDDDDLPSQFSLAAVWQVNRGLGFKIVGTSNPTTNAHSVTYAVLLKRWKQPRVACSILGRSDFATGKHGFLGIGLELETDASSLLGGQEEQFYTPQSAQVSNDDVPETKASLG